MKKKRKRKRGRGVNAHHIIPKSRTNDSGEIVMWDRTFHDTWHRLFGNLTRLEVKTFIDCIHCNAMEWNRKNILKLLEKVKKHEVQTV